MPLTWCNADARTLGVMEAYPVHRDMLEEAAEWLRVRFALHEVRLTVVATIVVGLPVLQVEALVSGVPHADSELALNAVMRSVWRPISGDLFFWVVRAPDLSSPHQDSPSAVAAEDMPAGARCCLEEDERLHMQTDRGIVLAEAVRVGDAVYLASDGLGHKEASNAPD